MLYNNISYGAMNNFFYSFLRDRNLRLTLSSFSMSKLVAGDGVFSVLSSSSTSLIGRFRGRPRFLLMTDFFYSSSSAIFVEISE